MAKVILLRGDAGDNARVAAQLLAENSHRFDALNQAGVAGVRVVALVGAILEQHLHVLPARVMEVTNYNIR